MNQCSSLVLGLIKQIILISHIANGQDVIILWREIGNAFILLVKI